MPVTAMPVTAMKARIPMRDRNIARTFAVLIYVLSLLLAFLAGGALDTHAVGYVPYLFVLGVGFAVLSPFIWFGAR
jgi:hypothetical protein